VFYLGTLLMAIMTVSSFVVLRETHEPTLLARKARRLRRKPLGNPHLRGKYETNMPRSAILARALTRPTKMLIQSPIVLSLSLYLALVYVSLTFWKHHFHNSIQLTRRITGLPLPPLHHLSYSLHERLFSPTISYRPHLHRPRHWHGLRERPLWLPL
jgi:hypothetical protein